MARILATYDLQRTSPDVYDEFVNQAEKLGWTPWKYVQKRQQFYRLPNTTLFGEFNNHEQAVASFKHIWEMTRLQGYTVNVEKWIVVEYSNSQFDSDVVLPE